MTLSQRIAARKPKPTPKPTLPAWLRYGLAKDLSGQVVS